MQTGEIDVLQFSDIKLKILPIYFQKLFLSAGIESLTIS